MRKAASIASTVSGASESQWIAEVPAARYAEAAAVKRATAPVPTTRQGIPARVGRFPVG